MPLSVLRGERAPGERWTGVDAALALALTRHEDSICSGCGHPLDETTTKDADRDRSGTHFYEVTESTCHGCREVAKHVEKASQPNSDGKVRPYLSAMKVSTVKRMRG